MSVSWGGFETLWGYMASTLSYRVVAFCLLSVPFTHVSGLLAAGSTSVKALKGRHGGNRYVLLACCSYVSAGRQQQLLSRVAVFVRQWLPSTHMSQPAVQCGCPTLVVLGPRVRRWDTFQGVHRGVVLSSRRCVRLVPIHASLAPPGWPPNPALTWMLVRSLPSSSALALALQLLWSFAALTILPVALDMLPLQYSLTKSLPHIPHSHVDVVSGAAAAVAFIGELFMIKAMLVYDDRRVGTGEPGKLSKVRSQPVAGVATSLAAAAPATGQGANMIGSKHRRPFLPGVAVQALRPTHQQKLRRLST